MADKKSTTLANPLLPTNASAFNLIGLANQGLQLFNGWDLQNAQYNGVNFYIAKPFGSGTITNLINTINTAGTLLGRSTNTFPLNNNLPQGTNEHLQEIRDHVKRKLVVHNLINTNSNIVEDLGFEPERFNGIGLIVGDNYYNAYSNLYNYFLARDGDVTFENIPLIYRNVLQHPIRGKIENVYLSELRVIHSSQRWKGILFEFYFIAEEVTTITKKTQSTINKINQIFNLIIASINNLLNIITQIQAYGNMLSTYFNSATPNNVVNFAHKTVPEIKNTTVPLLKNTATILYNSYNSQVDNSQANTRSNSAATPLASYTNYYFENQEVDYSKFAVLAPYINGLDDTNLNALLEIYNANIQNSINQINSYGLNIQANNLITELKNSYVHLLDLAKSLSINNSSQYMSYKVPHTMSIRELCFNNNLDFDDVGILKAIIAANPGKFSSVNKILEDTVLLLPKT